MSLPRQDQLRPNAQQMSLPRQDQLKPNARQMSLLRQTECPGDLSEQESTQTAVVLNNVPAPKKLTQQTEETQSSVQIKEEPMADGSAIPTATNMARPFSSLLMVEFISKVKGLESRPKMATRRWALQMESQYGLELVGEPKCIYLTQDDWDETYKHIDLLKSQFDLDVIESFPRPSIDSYVGAVREFLRTRPIAQNQQAIIDTGNMSEQFRWKNYVDSSGSKVSFEDWSAIRSIFRRAQSMQPVKLSPVQQPQQHMFLQLPHEWTSRLKDVLSKSDYSEVVISYEQVAITRGDVAMIVAEDISQSVTRNSRRGWLNDTVIKTFLKIIAAAKNNVRGYTSIVVVNSLVLQLKATNPQVSAKKAGIDITALLNIDMVFFPLHSAAYWKLAVAYPKTRSIVLYDSLGTIDLRELLTVRDWLKTGVGEVKSVEWDMRKGDCPRQGDDLLCGVFVCLNAYCVIVGGDLVKTYSPAAGDQLREYIAAIIYKGSTPFTEDIS